jgi:hypothetical protein
MWSTIVLALSWVCLVGLFHSPGQQVAAERP